ncbi:MAG: M14 family metallopeptidase [Sphingomonadales bacterium]
MLRSLFTLLLLAAALLVAAQPSLPPTVYETSGGRQTPTYAQLIGWWNAADKASKKITVLTKGPTDAGFPLHLALVSEQGYTTVSQAKKDGKIILLINNGIHPGEPDGIDASMLLVKELVAEKLSLPANVVLAIIPVYNIGGCLRRSENYRVDQEGPEAFGSRGNSQNLDLNRDFIKLDSKEAFSFCAIFQECDPDIFIDNHVSNGADYQHVMTLLTSQYSKLGGPMGAYLHDTFEPALYAAMRQKGYDLIPYVNIGGDKPEKGWAEFWDSPRYTSGYATLWNSFAFVPETHMLKPYSQRVASTKALMECFIDFAGVNGSSIRSLREETKKRISVATSFPISWRLDKSRYTNYTFKGYESGTKPSAISGQPRLYYDRSKPFTATVPVYGYYVPERIISTPKAYVIPQGWWKVIDRLQVNGIRMRRLSQDSTFEVEAYRIEDYSTAARPYEGHHANSNVKVSWQKQTLSFLKGDWYIPLDQPGNRFLMETLEPQAEDSYFAWNFFDPILGQKEGYSAYVFEDKAAAYLQTQPDLKKQLEQRVAADSSFAKSGRAQLDFIYKNSPWYEPDHNRYPVFRVMQ